MSKLEFVCDATSELRLRPISAVRNVRIVMLGRSKLQNDLDCEYL